MPQYQNQSSVEENTLSLHSEPPNYVVLLHNDDYTTMDFVVGVLEAVFHKSRSEAVEIMMRIHEKGVGVCGVYTKEIAEAQVALVCKLVEANGFPLLCTMEREA